MWSLQNKRLWYLFMPVVLALVVWGPYWGWNLVHDHHPWWRVPIISATVFDTHFYLQWLGQAVNGLDIGGHLGWFVWPLRWLARLMPQASISEWWLMSRWIAVTLVLWLTAWAMSSWSGLDTKRARFLALAFWLSFTLSLGMRPGVYSWYLPLGIFGLTAPIYVIRHLKNQQHLQAVVWTCAALLASSVYSWFLLFTLTWLASIWTLWLRARSQKLTLAILLATILATALVTPMAATWLTYSDSGQLFLDFLMKDSLSFTHLPQVTNSFFALLAWLMLLSIAALAVMGHKSQGAVERLVTLVWAGLALLCIWLTPPFMGVYLHNDHFRLPTMLFSWLSLAVLWSTLRNAEPLTLSRRSKMILAMMSVVSAAFIVRILSKPYPTSHDDLDVLHLSHWFTVAMAAWLLWSYGRRACVCVWPGLIMTGALLIGTTATISIYQREFAQLPYRVTQVPLVNWIMTNIPREHSLCSDPAAADFLSTFTGRRIFPTGTALYDSSPSTSFLKNMRTYTSGYDVLASGPSNTQYIGLINRVGRSLICEQFPWHKKILTSVGFSSQSLDDLMGCPRALLQKLDAYTQQSLLQTKIDGPAFTSLCQWVIISADQNKFWRLPGKEYQPIFTHGGTSIWRSKP